MEDLKTLKVNFPENYGTSPVNEISSILSDAMLKPINLVVDEAYRSFSNKELLEIINKFGGDSVDKFILKRIVRLLGLGTRVKISTLVEKYNSATEEEKNKISGDIRFISTATRVVEKLSAFYGSAIHSLAQADAVIQKVKIEIEESELQAQQQTKRLDTIYKDYLKKKSDYIDRMLSSGDFDKDVIARDIREINNKYSDQKNSERERMGKIEVEISSLYEKLDTLREDKNKIQEWAKNSFMECIDGLMDMVEDVLVSKLARIQ